MSNCRCCISLADSSTIESLQFPFISINCVVAISPISHGISCSFCNGSRPIVEDRGNVRYTRHKFMQLTQFQEFELMKFTLSCFPFQTLWTLIREPRASPISQLLTSFPPGKQLMPDKLSNLILRSCNGNFWDSTCKDRTSGNMISGKVRRERLITHEDIYYLRGAGTISTLDDSMCV